MLTPFAICAMTQATTRAWRRTLQISMALSLVPVVFSLNRGLWLSLGIGILYATTRFGMRGDFRQVGRLLPVIVILAAVVSLSPLVDLATHRSQHKAGDAGRLQRDQEA